MSVRRCQQEVDSAEFVEWMAFSGIDGLTAEMNDLRCGITTAAIYNVKRDTKRHPAPFVPADVVPWLKRPEAEAELGPILLEDKVAQANMIRAALFGKSRNG